MKREREKKKRYDSLVPRRQGTRLSLCSLVPRLLGCAVIVMLLNRQSIALTQRDTVLIQQHHMTTHPGILFSNHRAVIKWFARSSRFPTA